MKPTLTWLLAPISAGAFLATWGGWAKLATMTGYGQVEMLGGQEWSRFNIGIVLPMTVEPFGALAMAVAFNVAVRPWARITAGVMAISSLVMAAICQAVVHTLTVQGRTVAPDYVVTVTAVLPVIVLGLGAGLAMLNSARVADVDPSQKSSRPNVLGRIGAALGDAAATRAERLAETTRGTSQAQRIGNLGTSQAAVPGASSRPVQAVPESSQIRVPAAQPVRAAVKVDKDELLQKVARLRLGTNPDTGKQWSYGAIATELGISKSEANRLGLEAEQKLPAPINLTQHVFGTSHGTSEQKINGHEPNLEGVTS